MHSRRRQSRQMSLIWLIRGSLERKKKTIALLLISVICGMLFLAVYCPDILCTSTTSPQRSKNSRLLKDHLFDATTSQFPWSAVSVKLTDSDIDRRMTFDAKRDVLVFLHTQKTGGSTFGRHLVHDVVDGVPSPCVCQRRRKRCDCANESNHQWLFSRYSTGWACGLHADWTELHDCVPGYLDKREGTARNRRYVYVTVLRDPVQRYLSEWKHVQRGSTWLSAKLMCNGRQASLDEVPFCFKGSDWAGVTLREFMSCEHNLANNRQTRMLANLTLVGCYNRSFIADQTRRDHILFNSALENLRQMTFFGLTERQADTKYLFERTFGIHFRREFAQQYNTHAQKTFVDSDQLRAVQKLNQLDIALYDFATRLFDERLRLVRSEDRRMGLTDPRSDDHDRPAVQQDYDADENETEVEEEDQDEDDVDE